MTKTTQTTREPLTRSLFDGSPIDRQWESQPTSTEIPEGLTPEGYRRAAQAHSEAAERVEAHGHFDRARLLRRMAMEFMARAMA